MTKYNAISVSSLSSVNNTCTVKLIFNGHRWDKGKMTHKTYDRLFMIGRSIVSVLVHNDLYITVIGKHSGRFVMLLCFL